MKRHLIELAIIGILLIAAIMAVPALAVDAPKPSETELRLELRALDAEMQVMQGAYAEKTRRVAEITAALKAMEEEKKAKKEEAKKKDEPKAEKKQ